jgi:hypothetical protein
MAFDFSTLPKARAYGYMGKLGACTWYTPWDCYTPSTIQQAKDELEDAHVGVIDFKRAAVEFYNDAVANQAPGSVISNLGQDVQAADDLLRRHTQLMNTFYAETGTGVADVVADEAFFLSALGLRGLRGLGVAPLVLAELLGLSLRWVGFGILLYQLGDTLKAAANAFQSSFKSNQEKFKRDGDYYLAWRQAKDAGVEPPAPPDDSSVTDWTTIALIAGSVALAFMLMKK